MKDNQAKYPQLRFKGFTDPWEQRKLGETKTYFTDGNYGESYPSSQDMSDKENGVPFLRGSDFSNGYLDASNANYISKEKHAVLTSGHIENDDIVLSVRGSLGTLGYATKYNEGWNINSQLAILRTNKNELLGVFLIQYLLGSSGQKEILSRNTGTALKQLPIKKLKDIPVPIPIIEEQQQIGSFFKQLDNTIALHQRKLDLLKETKKGFLQKMFPKNGAKVPELRFAGFADDWEERKLGQYTKLITKGTTPKDKTGIGDVNFVKVENITNGKIYPINKIKQNEHDNYLKRSRLEEKDILFSIAGTLGRTAIVNKSILPANTNQALAIIRGYDFDTNFLITSLAGNVVKEYIRRNPTVGAQPNLSLEQVGNLLVNTPNAEEQQKIGSFFKQLDNTIALHQRKLEKLQELKKGYLQKMFC